MLVLGLVHDRHERPENEEPSTPASTWHLPWRPLAWFAVWCWLMALVPVAGDAFGGLAGFGVLIAAVGLASWRVERWCSRQYWDGLRDYKR